MVVALKMRAFRLEDVLSQLLRLPLCLVCNLTERDNSNKPILGQEVQVAASHPMSVTTSSLMFAFNKDTFHRLPNTKQEHIEAHKKHFFLCKLSPQYLFMKTIMANSVWFSLSPKHKTMKFLNRKASLRNFYNPVL